MWSSYMLLIGWKRYNAEVPSTECVRLYPIGDNQMERNYLWLNVNSNNMFLLENTFEYRPKLNKISLNSLKFRTLK